MSVHQKGLDRAHVRSTTVLEPDHEVESTLSEPDFGLLLPDETYADRPDHVARRQADAGCGGSIDGNAQLRKTGQFLDAEILDPFDVLDGFAGALRQRRETLEIGSEDPH